MRKSLSFIILLMLVFVLSGCDFFNTTTTATIPQRTEEAFKLDNGKTYKDVYNYVTNGGNAYMPSTGNVNVLIVPIWFENVGMTKNDKYINDIKKTFFGTETDTGWESIKSYFYESSYGKMNYSGYVTNWYTPLNNASFYEKAYRSGTYNKVIGELLVEVLNYYDSTLNYANYDSDNDRVVDAVYLLYNRPVEMTMDTVWWAWQAYYTGSEKFDYMDIYQYMWAGIDFMYYDNDGSLLTDGKLNASTFIHESTHLMGADDYYDYDENVYSKTFFGNSLVKSGEGCNYGVGDYDMMDANIGDHNAVTKMFLNWVNPYVVTKGTYNIDLHKFSSSGDSIIICPNWDESKNNLNEYFVIDFYDGGGLDSNNLFTGEQFNAKGVRIYHANATVEKVTNPTGLFMYDNSYTDHAFLALVDANKSINSDFDFIDSSTTASSKSLFKAGQTFVPNDCDEYVDKSLLNISVAVNSVSNDIANITIIVS